MGESEEQTQLDFKGFSLIDVSSENDCLINSPILLQPQIHRSSEKGSGQKSVKFAEAADTSSMEAMLGSFEDKEEVQKPPNSSRPEKTSKSGRYNLRKSLAWDSAFFTSAGVLDPEELSTMIGGEKCLLPGIQEDLNKSCDSLTTLDSETLVLESLEAELFEDIRASIQKSSKASSFSEKETQNVSSNKVKIPSQDKMEEKAAAKKPSCTQESGRTLNRISIHPQASQPVARIKESASLQKAPKGTKRITPVSATSTKRISLTSKNVKMEKDAKSVTGRGAPMLKNRTLGGSKNAVPRPTLPSKTTSCSPSSSNKELNTSSSSLESAGSSLSDMNSKSSLVSISGRSYSGRSTTSSGFTVRTPSRAVSRSKNLAEGSKLSAFLKSATTNLSASISPASSISEWSSASSSSNVAVTQKSGMARANIDGRPSDVLTSNKDAPQVLDSQDQSTSKCLVGNDALPVCSSHDGTKPTSGLCHTESTKPSGLRMPSPKIGFFDGVRSSSRTPKRSVLSQPAIPNGLPKTRVGAVSSQGSPNQAKLVKLKPADTLTLVHSSKADAKEISLGTKSKSLPQESPNEGRKISRASRNLKSNSLISPKVQNKMSLKSDVGSCLKAEQAGYEGSGLGIDSLDSSLVVEKKGSPDPQKHQGCSESTGCASLRSSKISSLDGGTIETSYSSSKCEVESSEKALEDETYKLSDSKSDLKSLCNANGNEQLLSKGQVARLARKFETVDINAGTQNESSDAPKTFVGAVDSTSRPKSVSPATSKVAANTRMPLSPKDSVCNANEIIDVSTELAMMDKPIGLAIPENFLQDNS